MLKAVSSEMLTVFADNANRAYFTLEEDASCMAGFCQCVFIQM